MEDKIIIRRETKADTRTCDTKNVSLKDLVEATLQHIQDVGNCMQFFAESLINNTKNHDNTKMSGIEQFYADFKTKFEQHSWYDMHKVKERHHLDKPEGVRADVNLLDVLEHVADCVAAGYARGGEVYDLELPNEVLQKAFKNTVELLKNKVELVDE